MATKTSETFSFAYALTKSGAVYTLVDANPSSPGVNPVADGVKAVDPNGGTVAPGETIKISDVASGVLSNGNKYTFIGTADLGGHKGLIIEDKHGDFFFLTDKAYKGNLN